MTRQWGVCDHRDRAQRLETHSRSVAAVGNAPGRERGPQRRAGPWGSGAREARRAVSPAGRPLERWLDVRSAVLTRAAYWAWPSSR